MSREQPAKKVAARLALPPRIEMIERQRRTGFQGLDGDVAAHFPNDGKIQKLVDQKPPVVVEIGHDDFEEVVGLARDEMTSDDLGQGDDSLLEAERPFVGVAVDLDADEYRKA